jgi:hypothetical protein
MKLRMAICGVLVFLLAAASADELFAQDKPAKKRSLTEIAKDAIDKNKAEVTKPGEQHKHLAAMAGNWVYTGKIWMGPDAPPVETSGTSTNTIILGGRYLKQEVKGEFQAVEFEGVGLVGFNKMMNRLESVWIDNMGTAMLIMNGNFDPEGKVVTSFGDYKDLMKGGMQKVKSISTMTGPDEIKDEMFMLEPDGTEIKTMELIYKRK